MMKITKTTGSENETTQFAEDFAKKLKGGEIIQLISDIGGGKTTFVKGLAKGLGSNDLVSSPTFKICNVYKGKFTINHCDFYRLKNDRLIEEEVSEMLGKDSIVVLEWAEKTSKIKNLRHIEVSIKYLSENSREITITDNGDKR